MVKAVLGKKRTKANWGNSKRTTDRLEIYESDEIPFRLIDSAGIKPSFLRVDKTIKLVKEWLKEDAKGNGREKQINVIWFCVDGTASRRMFPDTIKNLSKATAIWKSVPVIIVITKFFSVPKRKYNVAMVNNAFANSKHPILLKKIIPVGADIYESDKSA